MSATAPIRKLQLAGIRWGVSSCKHRNHAIGGKVAPASAALRRQSSSAWEGTATRTAAFRSWKGRPPQHPSHRTPGNENRFVSHSISRRGVLSGSVIATKTTSSTTTTRTRIPAGTRRTFLSDRNSPHELQGSSSRFTPLEDFSMDALAWTIALGLWYIPFPEFQNDEEDETSDVQDRPLEYREDYGPSVSNWYDKPKRPSGNNKKDD